jgi:PKD repeat protein
VTSQVQDMVNNPTVNFGWMLQLVTEQLYASMVFASSDNTIEAWRPKLTIIYQTCTPSIANFSYSINNDNVTFTDLSPSANSWYWDFGDGYFSNIQNPIHTYTEHGKFLCCLSKTDTCGSSSYCDTVYYCDNPNTRFTYTYEGHFVTFADSSKMADSWFWNFGDGFYSDLQNPIHYFDCFGTYYVCLTSTNACKQETFCDSVSIKVNGIDELKDDYFLLYPNPTRNQLFVSINKKIPDSKIVFTIANSSGKNVKITELLHSGNSGEMILDISDLPSGVFYLKMTLLNETIGKKFIKI